MTYSLSSVKTHLRSSDCICVTKIRLGLCHRPSTESPSNNSSSSSSHPITKALHHRQSQAHHPSYPSVDLPDPSVPNACSQPPTHHSLLPPAPESGNTYCYILGSFRIFTTRITLCATTESTLFVACRGLLLAYQYASGRTTLDT